MEDGEALFNKVRFLNNQVKEIVSNVDRMAILAEIAIIRSKVLIKIRDVTIVEWKGI